MQFNKEIFFRDYEARAGKLSNVQRGGLEFLLDQISLDNDFKMVREIAYVLATVKGETGVFQPIREKRASQTRQPDLFRRQQRYFPSGFFGRGYVQLTFVENYRDAGKKLAGTVILVPNENGSNGSQRAITVDAETFVSEPNLVMEPTVAYLILSRGMREGWFRGRRGGARFKLSDFIKEGQPPDYINARNIINGGLDKAKMFARFAEQFELALRAALAN